MAVLDQADCSSVVSGLLLRWQEARHAGRRVTADDLCAEHPELIEEVRRQIQAFESMEALLGVAPDHATGSRTTCEDASVLAGLDPHALPGFELLGILGQGGMGIVFRARQLRPWRWVALKMCLAGPQATAEQRARFRTEAEAAAALHHPNIVQIHEVGEHNGQPYLVMELVEGGSLAERLRQAVLPARAAAAMLHVLAEAVAAAHEHGIIHRDLKPGNVLLRKEDATAALVPVITDFGLAKRQQTERDRVDASWRTRTGAVLGTASYMAPEQAHGKGEATGPRTDVYALGAILYEMLTGRPPFKGETLLDTLEQVRSQEAVSPSRLRLGVPRDLETICLQCLEKVPARRYASARALAEDLRRFLAGEPILARPASLVEKTLKWIRRKPAWAALVLVSTLAAAGLLGGWAWFTVALHQERETANRERLRALEQEAIAKMERETAQGFWTTASQQRDRAERLLGEICAAVEDHAQVMTRAKGEAAADPTPGGVLFALARTYARNAVATATNPNLPDADRRQLAEKYASRAVKLLVSAGSLGYFRDPAKLAQLRQDPELQNLRPRADFLDLLRQLMTGNGRVEQRGE